VILVLHFQSKELDHFLRLPGEPQDLRHHLHKAVHVIPLRINRDFVHQLQTQLIVSLPTIVASDEEIPSILA
jgi:hypothetical protein